MHAVLCHSWKSRVKGRDWYDMVWYVARSTPLDLAHLEARMRQSGHLAHRDALSEQSFRELLLKRIESVDLASAAADVRRFLAHPSAIDVWSPEFFVDLAHRIVTRP